MNDDVKNILNNLLGSKHIDAFILYKFLKGNVTEVDELLNIVDSLLKENFIYLTILLKYKNSRILITKRSVVNSYINA